MPLDQPRPDAATATRVPCPACGHPFPWPPTGRCGRCGVDLQSDAATAVFDLDRRWAGLAAERLALVRELEATRPPVDDGADAAGGAPPPWTFGTQPAPRPVGGGRGVPALLGIAGAALLTAAAVVFTAVAWTTLPALAKAAILLVATTAAAGGALRLHGRGITTAAAALGALTMTLALVDVAGADRVGLVELGDFAVPLGLLAAALAGWLLSHREVGWVAGLGCVAAAAGAFGVVVVVVDVVDLTAPGATLVASAAAAALGAVAPTWPTRIARLGAGLLAGLGLTVAGLVSVVSMADEATAIAAGLGAIAVPVAIAAAATVLTAWALVPASLLVTSATIATAAASGVADWGVAVVVAATVATVAWVAALLDPRWRVPVLVGAAPVALIAVGTTATAAGLAVERLGEHLAGATVDSLDPWAAVSVPIVALALGAWPRLRRHLPLVVAVTLAIVVGALPTTAASAVLAGAALTGPLLDRFVPRDLGDLLSPGLGLAALAVGWASDASWALAVTSAATVAVAAHVVWHEDDARAVAAAGIGTAAAGLGVGAALDAVGAATAVSLGGILAVVLAVTAPLQRWGRDRLTGAALVTSGIATLVVPTQVDDARAAGVLLLLAAVGWLAIAAAGWWPARWIASVVASVGTGVLLGDAEVETVEAYTVVPVLTLGAVGVLWLRRDAELRTLTALWPALSVAVVPSLLTLAEDPQVLLRALLLAGIAGALAGVGIALRWLAPVLAGGIAAVGVALTQLAVVAEVVPRWVTFAVVGGVLVWLAATYERQQARARALTGRLARLR